MQVQGAVIREQGQTFAVVVVKPHVVQNQSAANMAITGLVPVFRVPVILMAQDSYGRPTYYGRPDLARFMSSVPLNAVSWRAYTIRQSFEIPTTENKPICHDGYSVSRSREG